MNEKCVDHPINSLDCLTRSQIQCTSTVVIQIEVSHQKISKMRLSDTNSPLGIFLVIVRHQAFFLFPSSFQE